MSKDISGIYQIECTVSGKSYVGSSQAIYKRWYDHRRLLRKGTHVSPRLQQAWNKHGEPNFSFSVLEECERDQLFEREQHWIDLKRRDYNSMPIVRVFTPEMRRKAVAKLRARAAAITHCPAGHEYTPENMLKGRRVCKECARIWTAERIAAETPEQARRRLDVGLKKYYENHPEKRAKQNEYAERTREQKAAYDRANLDKKRARRAKARAEGRAYG